MEETKVVQKTQTREQIIVRTSILGIIVNVAIALVKIIIGLSTASIAIVSEGINNITDALSSVMTFVGAKLAKKHPDEKHPFGYGRIEYLTSLVISGVILFAGIEMIISSVDLIIHPVKMTVSYLSIIIVFGVAVIKFFLGMHTIRMGRKAASQSLIAVGTECRSDSFASIITIVSSLIFLIFGVSLDAYAGILISLLIVKAGFDSLKETVEDLLGRRGDQELAKKLYKEIRSTDGVIGAADLMLHNYGPEAWSGSVNLEIDHKKTVGEIYSFLHRLQLHIMHDYNVTMVFGIYAVDNDSPCIKELRGRIGSFVRSHEHIKSYHAVYLDSSNNDIYCDFIVDYQQMDWEGLRSEFETYMSEYYPGRRIELTVETEYV